jgi:type IV secretion system protein VirB5
VKLCLRLAAFAAVALLSASPAGAQQIVHDPINYASLIQQAQTALSQLQQLRAQLTQGQQLYASLNTASNVGSIAGQLNTPSLRAFLPDVTAFEAAAKGDFSGLAQLGQQAQTIRQANRLYTPPASDPMGQDLEAAGDRAARDMALGQQTAATGAQRLTGLQTLNASIDGAADARAVLDLQARLLAEHAMIANDQMRLQGLAMTQAAEDRMAAQRTQERAAAAAQARLQLYQSGFQ